MHDTEAASPSRASSPTRPRAATAALPSQALRVSGRSNIRCRLCEKRPKSRLRVRADERNDLRPRILGRRGDLFLLAVEEAVRCAFVRDELVVRGDCVEGGL